METTGSLGKNLITDQMCLHLVQWMKLICNLLGALTWGQLQLVNDEIVFCFIKIGVEKKCNIFILKEIAAPK